MLYRPAFFALTVSFDALKRKLERLPSFPILDAARDDAHNRHCCPRVVLEGELARQRNADVGRLRNTGARPMDFPVASPHICSDVDYAEEQLMKAVSGARA